MSVQPDEQAVEQLLVLVPSLEPAAHLVMHRLPTGPAPEGERWTSPLHGLQRGQQLGSGLVRNPVQELESRHPAGTRILEELDLPALLRHTRFLLIDNADRSSRSDPLGHDGDDSTEPIPLVKATTPSGSSLPITVSTRPESDVRALLVEELQQPSHCRDRQLRQPGVRDELPRAEGSEQELAGRRHTRPMVVHWHRAAATLSVWNSQMS